MAVYRKNKDNIFDIVLFGSAVKSKEFISDVDVAVIFKDEKNDAVLDRVRSLDVHADYVLLAELYSERLWRTLIREGVSVVHNKKVSDIFGLECFGLFTYNLTNIKRKSRFSQVLTGYKSESMLKKTEGILLRPGVVLIPIKKLELFRTFLETWQVDYTLKIVYIE